jgi:hypothetical protein
MSDHIAFLVLANDLVCVEAMVVLLFVLVIMTVPMFMFMIVTVAMLVIRINWSCAWI